MSIPDPWSGRRRGPRPDPLWIRLGRWLRGEQARSILGWTGAAMLTAALVWAAVRFLG